ncbi:MAG: hypothetical protein KF736_11790 [Acidobacteria bacterium]|nr:hypothetical protein [Acidobacteriota bacterium]MCW5948754.1 hypothetical protein [Pyrinomonadaceae bacterium]
MRLPNGENAIVDIRKLTEYCLNFDDLRGRHKARVFASALGITVANAAEFREQLLHVAATTESAVVGESDAFGQRYVIDFSWTTAEGTAPIRSTWIVLTDEENPRLTSCYVLKRRQDA